MKDFKFILNKGRTITFSKNNSYSGYVFNLDKDLTFEVTIYTNNDKILSAEFVYRESPYSMIKIYADEIRLDNEEVSIQQLLELGGLDNE